MCYNAEVSLVPFVLSIMTSSLLIKNSKGKHKKTINIIGFFFIYIALVQGLEYLMWIDIDCQNGLNIIATKIIPYIIYLQPCILFYIATIFEKKQPPLLWVINVIYSIIVIFILYNKTNIICSKPGGNGHLQWNTKFTYMPIFIICYLGLAIINIFSVLNLPYALFTFAILTISYLYSYYYIYESIGEMWCFFGALLPILILLFKQCI